MCIVDWENNRTDPAIEFYPAIVDFLGYFPFSIDDTTFAGKVKKYRFQNGLSLEAFGKVMNAAGATIYRIENKIGTAKPQLLKRLECILKGQKKKKYIADL
jgi:DNA-binding XRE family transcriptional regulator